MAGVEDACKSLSSLLPGRTSLPGQPDYVSSLLTYFSAQAGELSPACIVFPTDSSEVSIVLKTLSKFQIKFAVRGGGHTLNAGASNIDFGVVISLRSMNTVQVSDDKASVRIGGGAKWREVYAHLDPLGLAISGGRVADVGVGGLCTGGGISFFSAREGLVCDNIMTCEVVLSSGEVVQADQEQNIDLWKALKGGSLNFGIVAAFTIRCFPQSSFYGGCIVAPISSIESQLRGLMYLLEANDQYAAIIMSISWNKDRDSFSVFTNLEYTQQTENPDVLKPFTEAQPQFLNTMRTSTLGDFADEAGKYAKPGPRYQFATTTVHCPNSEILNEVYSIFKASVPTIKHIEGINWAMSLQPFPVSTGPLVLILLSYHWIQKCDDEAVTAAAKSFIAEIGNFAKHTVNECGFRYLNYAASWQDPIASYGVESVRELRKASEKYDPEGMFWKLCPGGFKIPRPV